MATAKRIYVVSTPAGNRLVNAANRMQAENHVARKTISARVAGQMDLIGRAKEDIEEASASPEQLSLEAAKDVPQ
jgi:hypothetical protein